MNQETQNALDLLHRGHKVLLREVGRICRKHGISWFLESGTLLGAVRHKSAIPWDDDADVFMPRADSEIFIKEWQKQKADGRFVLLNETDETFTRNAFATLVDTSGTLIKNYQNCQSTSSNFLSFDSS